MIQENFIKLYEQSFRENWDLPCYTDYGEDESYSYGQVAQEIAKLHLLFKHCSLRRGDKIAIIGKNIWKKNAWPGCVPYSPFPISVACISATVKQSIVSSNTWMKKCT